MAGWKRLTKKLYGRAWQKSLAGSGRNISLQHGKNYSAPALATNPWAFVSECNLCIFKNLKERYLFCIPRSETIVTCVFVFYFLFEFIVCWWDVVAQSVRAQRYSRGEWVRDPIKSIRRCLMIIFEEMCPGWPLVISIKVPSELLFLYLIIFLANEARQLAKQERAIYGSG